MMTPAPAPAAPPAPEPVPHPGLAVRGYGAVERRRSQLLDAVIAPGGLLGEEAGSLTG